MTAPILLPALLVRLAAPLPRGPLIAPMTAAHVFAMMVLSTVVVVGAHRRALQPTFRATLWRVV